MRRTLVLWTSLALALVVTRGAAAQPPQDTQDRQPPEESDPAAPTGEDPEVDTEGMEGDAAGEAGLEPAEATMGTPTAAASAGQQGEIDAGAYAVRLRDLEQRVNELKEQIFRSKARLSLLAETVLQGVVAGSQASIVHVDKMSSSFQLVKAVYALDGAPIFNRSDEEGLFEEEDTPMIYDGSIVPGEHTLTVNLEYRGHGYGVFSYLEGYRFRVRSNYTFTAPEGRGVRLRVVAFEKGGPAAPMEERPAVRYIERVSAGGNAAGGE